MHLSVISPDKEIFEGVVSSITVPGVNGKFQILENHAPIVSALEKGEAKLILDNGEEKFINTKNSEIGRAHV